jgi:hypothetical protein
MIIKSIKQFLARSLSEYARGRQERKLLIMDTSLAKQLSRDSPGFKRKFGTAYYKYLYKKRLNLRRG